MTNELFTFFNGLAKITSIPTQGNHMKITLAILLCLSISTSQADFRDAQENYNQKNYKQAFDEFLVLAKFGNLKSQHNIAVMLANGQGVEQNLPQAYAWSKISDSFKDYAELTRALKKQLPQDQLLKAEKLTKEYFDQYAQVNSKVLLGPIVTKQTTDVRQSAYKSVERIPPNYPRTMALKGIQGWVDVIFYVYPDGSARDFQVIEEVPSDGLFAIETIKSIEKYHFTFNSSSHKSDEPIPTTTRIDFKLKGAPKGFSKKQQDYLDKLIENARNGDIEAQYSYSILYDTFLKKEGVVDGKEINQWLFNAAQNGIVDAQYRLGKNIYYGKSCKVEKQKGLDWIMKAAQIGNADAEYMAYQMLQNKNIINQSNQPPIYWLKQAAKNGLDIAQIRYAKEIASLPNPTTTELKLAQEYLISYKKNVYKTIQWYQTHALVQNKLNKHSKALKSIKAAIKSAKTVGWDLTELEQQRDLILAQKS